MSESANHPEISRLVRTIPDYPKPGIMFRDITSLLADGPGFKHTIEVLVRRFAGITIDKIAGLEARGFIIGAPLAAQLGVGFVPIRKKGKLPHRTLSHEYELEYGNDVVEIHADAIKPGEVVLLVDDLLATGGTAGAGIQLIEQLGGRVLEAAFVIDLPELGGRAKLEAAGYNVFSLIEFEGE